MKKFTLGSSSIGELEKKYVLDVLNKNYISPGPVVAQVEDICSELHGLEYGLAVNSGQGAIHVAIQAIAETRLSKGKRPLVAVPACTYISTLAAAVLAGCDIILVDVEIPSGNMSPIALANTIIAQRLAGNPIDIVVPVHLYGKACSPLIFSICEEYGLWVVEDACESTFAPGIGKGHILTTSFYTNHLISAGCGGLIMTNDSDLDEYCWKLINHGRSARFGNDDIYRISEKFHFDTWGHSLKWNDVSAAIALAQIERRRALYSLRSNNALRLYSYLGELESVFLPNDLDDHTYMMYPIILKEPLNTLNVIKHLNDNGVEVRRMMPITNQPVVQNYFGSDLKKEFPVADFINRQGFYVGCHPELSKDDIDEMGRIIYEAIKLEVDRVQS